jgi:hypothetical protein
MSDPQNDAVVFLKLLRPGGPWVLSAIVPDGAIETTTALTADDIRKFVRDYNGKRNLYYSVNPTRKPMASKAAKVDIAAIEYLLADLDPEDTEEPETAKARYLTGLDKLKPVPTGIIDSGNGIQVLLKLAEPIALAEPVWGKNAKGEPIKVYPEATAKQIADVEGRVKLLMETLGSVAGTQNIDRILRIPGTINLPNAKKLKAGRTKCETRLIKFNGATCKLEDFPTAKAEPPPDNDGANANNAGSTDEANKASSGNNKAGNSGDTIDWTKVDKHAGWLKGVGDLPDNFSAKGKAIVAHAGNLADLNFDVTRAGSLSKPYKSWSEVSFALAATLKNDGRFSNEQIAAALLCNIPCNEHITKIKDTTTRYRAVERLILRSYNPPPGKKRVQLVGEPNWRERSVDGSPIPSMHNARLAITAIGVECSYDTFHEKLLFGYADDDTRHVVAQFLGEVSDHGIMGLRRLLSDRFGFDLTEKHVRDAVISLALQHCFDPVADMLNEAEARWDGVERLGKVGC